MGRGRGKGGRHRNVHYVASAEQIEKRNQKDAEYAAKRLARRGLDASTNKEESESEEDEDAIAQSTLLREQREEEEPVDEMTRKRLEALRLLEEDAGGAVTEVLNEGVENLNRNRKTNIKVSQIDMTNIPQTRKDREREEAARRKAEYDRRHAAHETEQAMKDLARLREVQARRKAAAGLFKSYFELLDYQTESKD